MGYWVWTCVVLVALELILRMLKGNSAPALGGDALRLREETQALVWNDLAGATRIVAFGDSIPHGWGLEYSESYPVVLEQMLRGSCPDQRVKVINAGIPGNTILLGWQRLERDVLGWKPDVALIGFGLNDVNLARSAFDERREAAFRRRMAPAGRVKAVLRRSLLWSTAVDAAKGLRRRSAHRPVEDSVGKQLLSRTTEDVFEKALRNVTHRIQRAGAKAFLLTMTPVSRRLRTPRGVGAELRELVARYNEVTRTVAQCQGAMLIDVHAGMSARPDVEELIGWDGVHLNSKGQEVLAHIVHGALLENVFRVPAKPADRARRPG